MRESKHPVSVESAGKRTLRTIARGAVAGAILLSIMACGNRVDVVVSSAVALQIENERFDKKAVAVPPATEVTVAVTNRDDIPHAFAVYYSFEFTDAVFEGGEVAPGETREYTFESPDVRAHLWFACPLHPAESGKFVVSPQEEVKKIDVSKD